MLICYKILLVSCNGINPLRVNFNTGLPFHNPQPSKISSQILLALYFYFYSYLATIYFSKVDFMAI